MSNGKMFEAGSVTLYPVSSYKYFRIQINPFHLKIHIKILHAII